MADAAKTDAPTQTPASAARTARREEIMSANLTERLARKKTHCAAENDIYVTRSTREGPKDAVRDDEAMIRYDLKCRDGHGFEAWFASSAAFDEQKAGGFVSCAVCGSGEVEKSLMAPGVAQRSGGAVDRAAAKEPDGADAPAADASPTNAPMLSGPLPPEVSRQLAALRKEIEAKSDYVGAAFATEARRMHLGETEARSIHGQASGEEAKALLEEGVPVAPLPFSVRRDD